MGASNRRTFLHTGAAAGLLAGRVVSDARAAGANDRIRFGLIGCGGQGRHNMNVALQNAEVDVVAVCDVDPSRMEKASEDVEKKSHRKPAKIADFRALLDDKSIDAVIIGTPDHWHAAPMMAACAAKKDVYVEKPISHNIVEGRKMVDAARKYERVVQVGTQQRSGEHFQKAVEIVKSGVLGKITQTRTWNFGNETPNGIGKGNDDPPAGVDYDRWLGPAPKRPFNSNRYHYQWRWFFDYAAGMVGDWNVHLQDIVHWAMGQDSPKSVSAAGGKLVLADNRDTPDTMEVVYEFDGFLQTYSMRKTNSFGFGGKGYGILFHGTDATLFVDRGGYEVFAEKDRKISIAKGKGSPQNEPHMKNFLACMKTRARPICDIEITHKTTVACHLANISLKLGRKIFWDANREIVVDGVGAPDKQAAMFLSREYRKGYELPVV